MLYREFPWAQAKKRYSRAIALLLMDLLIAAFLVALCR
jgi:hypothetical protein